MTNILRIGGYILCALFLFGAVSVATKARRTLSKEEQAAVDSEVREFSGVLRKGQVPLEAAAQLTARYRTNLEEQRRVLLVAGSFMAGASALTCGLLGV